MSPPGAPRIREYRIHPALSPFVKSVWSLEDDGAVGDAPRERILPDSCVELVFHFRDPFRSHFASGGSALQPRSFVVGQMTRFLEIEPAGRAGFVAVRFQARGAYLFFHRPLSEVAAGVVDLGDLLGTRAGEWTDRIAVAKNMEDRVRLLEGVLLGLLGANGRTDPAVDRAIDLIETTRGQIRVSGLAAEIGVSGRHLARQFQRAVGLRPKQYARIRRFVHTIQVLHSGNHRSLADLAADCGYYDQAHLNHEFKELAGLSPGEVSTHPNLGF